jgi:hypothetical protein
VCAAVIRNQFVMFAGYVQRCIKLIFRQRFTKTPPLLTGINEWYSFFVSDRWNEDEHRFNNAREGKKSTIHKRTRSDDSLKNGSWGIHCRSSPTFFSWPYTPVRRRPSPKRVETVGYLFHSSSSRRTANNGDRDADELLTSNIWICADRSSQLGAAVAPSPRRWGSSQCRWLWWTRFARVNGLSRSGCPRLVVRHVTKIIFLFHHYKNAAEEKKTSWLVECGHRSKENSQDQKKEENCLSQQQSGVSKMKFSGFLPFPGAFL